MAMDASGTEVCRAFRNNGRCRYGEECNRQLDCLCGRTVSQVIMAMDASGTEVCRAFRNNGRCRYGEECNYVHSEGDPIEPPPRGQCFNWEQTGACAYGDRCRYVCIVS
mmetsp:Transcript_23050/g.61324  ORF Transcript_23050/g.61324 Transcript_23050/m.61324 type:complete len:109 (+) Transcript_23050:676-1002(+)